MFDFMMTAVGVGFGFGVGVIFCQINFIRWQEENVRRQKRHFASMLTQAQIDAVYKEIEEEKFQRMMVSGEDGDGDDVCHGGEVLL